MSNLSRRPRSTSGTTSSPIMRRQSYYLPSSAKSRPDEIRVFGAGLVIGACNGEAPSLIGAAPSRIRRASSKSSRQAKTKFTFTFTFICHPGKTHNHRSIKDEERGGEEGAVKRRSCRVNIQSGSGCAGYDRVRVRVCCDIRLLENAARLHCRNRVHCTVPGSSDDASSFIFFPKQARPWSVAIHRRRTSLFMRSLGFPF